MKVFLDDQNREWKLNLTWAKAEEIFQRCERKDSAPEDRKTFDLFNMTDKDQVEAFVVTDPITGRFDAQKAKYLVNIIYVLCEQQVKERNMTDTEFGTMLCSSLFARAWEAFMEEVGNFIPDPERKTMFQNLLYLAGGTQQAALSEVNQILTEKRTALDAHIHQTITGQMEKAWMEVERNLAKAVEDAGTTTSSNSAGLSGLSPAVS